MERAFSGTRVLRGRDSLGQCRNRPDLEKRVKSDSRRLHTSLTSGLPPSSVNFVLASHVHAKLVTPKQREEGIHPSGSYLCGWRSRTPQQRPGSSGTSRPAPAGRSPGATSETRRCALRCRGTRRVRQHGVGPDVRPARRRETSGLAASSAGDHRHGRVRVRRVIGPVRRRRRSCLGTAWRRPVPRVRG